MKYTKYIIDGKFIDTQVLEAMPKILLPVTITVALIALAFCAGAIPFAFTYDSFRTLKYEMVKFERRHHYAQTVVESKVFRYAVVKPINVVVVNPIHSILRNVA
jgi:hypothetical protein